MKLTVLVDNQTLIDRYFRAEPGAAFWLEADGKRILFDTGYSDLFLENGRKMGIEPTLADHVVLSHGHNDHTWGLGALVTSLTERHTELGQTHRPVLTAHPEALLPKRYEGQPIGSLLGEDTLARHLELRFSKAPLQLTEHLHWLGEIPRRHPFEGREPLGEALGSDGWAPDRLSDDSALAWQGPRGLVIVTGCSHAGICNIVSQAMDVTGEERVRAVIGGFHLLKPEPEKLAAVIRFFRDIGVQKLHACHCTGFAARAAFAAVLDQEDIGVGSVLEF